jgi:hypothetical protein
MLDGLLPNPNRTGCEQTLWAYCRRFAEVLAAKESAELRHDIEVNSVINQVMRYVAIMFSYGTTIVAIYAGYKFTNEELYLRLRKYALKKHLAVPEGLPKLVLTLIKDSAAWVALKNRWDGPPGKNQSVPDRAKALFWYGVTQAVAFGKWFIYQLTSCFMWARHGCRPRRASEYAVSPDRPGNKIVPYSGPGLQSGSPLEIMDGTPGQLRLSPPPRLSLRKMAKMTEPPAQTLLIDDVPSADTAAPAGLLALPPPPPPPPGSPNRRKLQLEDTDQPYRFPGQPEKSPTTLAAASSRMQQRADRNG